MYQGRTLKLPKILPTLSAVLAVATCNLAHAGASMMFDYPSGFAGVSAIHPTISAALVGTTFNLTNRGQEHEAGGIWYTTQQNITSFSTDFTFQITPASTPTIQGITFAIQNTNSTENSVNHGINAGTDANLAGYGTYDLPDNAYQQPMKHSVAILFNLNDNDQYNYPVGGKPSATGLYINGGPRGAFLPEMDLNSTGINLYSGHIMAAHVVYDGSILTMTLRDTSTNAQFRTSWPVDIPAIVGGNTAWVGFTGGEIPPTPQKILTWNYYQGYATRLATPSFSVAAGQYSSAQTVTISAPPGSTVYYTTNGQQPTTSSTKYSGPITVDASEVVQAVAVESGYTDSQVGVANYQVAPSGSPVINFPNGLANASHLITVNGTAKFNGSALQLTDTSANSEVGTAWYAVPVNVQSFTTNFTLSLQNARANGMTFTIQNQPPASSDTSILYVSGGPNALANSASGLGYSGSTNGVGGQIAGLLSSVAVKFDLYNDGGDATGLYTNGADPSINSINMSSSGVSLHSGNPLNVTMHYNGSSLSMTVTDSKTKKSFSKSWSINIPETVGGNTAYVGFTAATGGLTADQQVTAWTYATAATQSHTSVPAAPTNLTVQ